MFPFHMTLTVQLYICTVLMDLHIEAVMQKISDGDIHTYLNKIKTQHNKIKNKPHKHLNRHAHTHTQTEKVLR